MTEENWLAEQDPEALLAAAWGLSNRAKARRLIPTESCRRKVRLASCAVCRDNWGWFRDPLARRVVEEAEALADRKLDERRLWRTARDLKAARAGRLEPWTRKSLRLAEWALLSGRGHAHRAPAQLFRSLGYYRAVANASPDQGPWSPRHPAVRAEVAKFVSVVRDLFGNPFARPTPIDPAVIAWSGGVASEIAREIYAEHAFDQLPVLADALEDAGCRDDALLDHLRAPGPHARGCWGLDRVLSL